MEFALLISGLVFVLMFVVLMWAFSLFQSRQQAKEWGDRVKGNTTVTNESKKDEGLGYIKTQMLQVLEKLGQANKPKDQAETSRLRKTLVSAGYRSPRASIIFLGTKLFLMLICVGLFALFGGELTKDKPMSYFIGGMVGSAVMGFYAPQLWLSTAVQKRKERIIDGFPDALP